VQIGSRVTQSVLPDRSLDADCRLHHDGADAEAESPARLRLTRRPSPCSEDAHGTQGCPPRSTWTTVGPGYRAETCVHPALATPTCSNSPCECGRRAYTLCATQPRPAALGPQRDQADWGLRSLGDPVLRRRPTFRALRDHRRLGSKCSSRIQSGCPATEFGAQRRSDADWIAVRRVFPLVSNCTAGCAARSFQRGDGPASGVHENGRSAGGSRRWEHPAAAAVADGNFRRWETMCL
jgi:hypothetical protein